MVEPKLVIAYIGQDVEDFIEMSLDSIKDVADAIVFVDGGSKDKTKEIFHRVLSKKGMTKEINIGVLTQSSITTKYTLINRRYEQELKGANGRARNGYLDFIKKHYDGWWCLVIDPDEVVENPERIKLVIEAVLKNKAIKGELEKHFILHPAMRHLILTIDKEDTSVEKHHCLGRLFNIQKNLFYPKKEHPIIQSKTHIFTSWIQPHFTLWHLGYIPHVFQTRKRYLNNIQKSTMHTKGELHSWYLAHIFGHYPTTKIDILQLPKIIRNFFFPGNLEEILYFELRKILEPKYSHDIFLWKKHFNPKKMLFCGCGLGHRLLVADTFDIEAYGFDISKHAVENTPYKNLRKKDILRVGDITKKIPFDMKFDLVVCYDLLEHLEEKDLDKALQNILKVGTKIFLFSIPFDRISSDLYLDHTHKIFKTRDWWIKRIEENGFKIEDPPKNYQYAYQLLLGTKK